MRLRIVAVTSLLSAMAVLPACAGTGQDMSKALSSLGSLIPGKLSDSDILAGLRQALAQGTTTAITSLGQADGFWKDDAARIPLPPFLSKYESTVRAIGYGTTVDQFQLTLNRAAEQAVPKVATIFSDAISKMSVEDASAILHGQPDAATQFFRRTASTDLLNQIHPIVAEATAKVGVTQQYKKLTGKAGAILRLSGSKPPVDLDDYVSQQALNGLFLKIADEEARIRANPAARGTEVLKKVFGSK